MSDDPRRLVTQEQWDRLHIARNNGGGCAACGRPLVDGEAVYVEQLVIDIPRPPGQYVGARRGVAQAPVGAECASPGTPGSGGGMRARAVRRMRPADVLRGEEGDPHPGGLLAALPEPRRRG